MKFVAFECSMQSLWRKNGKKETKGNDIAKYQQQRPRWNAGKLEHVMIRLWIPTIVAIGIHQAWMRI